MVHVHLSSHQLMSAKNMPNKYIYIYLCHWRIVQTVITAVARGWSSFKLCRFVLCLDTNMTGAIGSDRSFPCGKARQSIYQTRGSLASDSAAPFDAVFVSHIYIYIYMYRVIQQPIIAKEKILSCYEVIATGQFQYTYYWGIAIIIRNPWREFY